MASKSSSNYWHRRLDARLSALHNLIQNQGSGGTMGSIPNMDVGPRVGDVGRAFADSVKQSLSGFRIPNMPSPYSAIPILPMAGGGGGFGGGSGGGGGGGGGLSSGDFFRGINRLIANQNIPTVPEAGGPSNNMGLPGRFTAGVSHLSMLLGPEAMIIEASLRAIGDAIKKTGDFLKETVGAYSPMTISLLDRAWRDLYATIGYMLEPAVNSLTAGIRYLANMSGGAMSTVRADVQRLMNDIQKLSTELKPLLDSGIGMGLEALRIQIGSFRATVMATTLAIEVLSKHLGGIFAPFLKLFNTVEPINTFGFAAGSGGQRHDPAEMWKEIQSSILRNVGAPVDIPKAQLSVLEKIYQKLLDLVRAIDKIPNITNPKGMAQAVGEAAPVLEAMRAALNAGQIIGGF